MKRIGLIAFAIVVLIATLLCLSKVMAETSRADPLAWLDNSGCALPCWHNVVPGVTSFPEALTLLQNMPDVDQNSIDGRSELSTTWLWFIYRTGSHRIYVEFDGEISAQIRSIWFYPVRDGDVLTIHLADLDARFGPPQMISAVSANNSLLHLTYSVKGVEALVFMPRGSAGRLGCDRLQTSAGLYLGAAIARTYEDRWHGFTRRFNQACALSP